jgi:pyridoxine 4-dehydrogenase
VNLIDTADSYGPDVSEELIAEALYPYPADLVIATKGGQVRSGPDKWTPNGQPAHLHEAVDSSLKRLQLDRIDLYQLHRPDPKVPFEESVLAVAEMQRAGKVRHVGLSNVNVAQIERARAIVPIVSVQNRYNNETRGSAVFNGVTDDETVAVVEYCTTQGIAFFPWGPLAAGKLASERLSAIAQKRGATPNQIALAWLLRRSPVIIPIPGTASIQHLEENIAAGAIALSDDEFQALAG